MAISIYSNRAAYHNFGAPSRTTVELARKPVSDRVVEFSFTWALSQSPRFPDLFPEVSEEEKPAHSALSKLISTHYKDSKELFERIGDPIFPSWKADFLIGFRSFDSVLTPPPVLCEDPRFCAGVLSLCVGTLYLPRRSPDLSWGRLLDLPVAFDDVCVRLP